MNKNYIFKKIQEVLNNCQFSILYSPLKDEIDYDKLQLPFIIPNTKFVLSVNKEIDPYQCVNDCKLFCKNGKVCVMIPGQKFDIKGTRYGRGFGWYDRFLSKIPSDWIRIGIADSARFQKAELSKNTWDESVDWVVVYNYEILRWNIFETNARLE